MVLPSIQSSARFKQGIDINALASTLCELGRVEHLKDLGSAGPLTASAGEESVFRCLFGRDALRMAADLLEDFPAVARSTLIQFARLQGVRDNPRGEEEPGRILHEHRRPGDPYAALLKRHWDLPYYGAVDTTPQWINVLVTYCKTVGDRSILRTRITNRLRRRVTLLDSLLAAVGWLERRLDHHAAHGYLWVRRSSSLGIANQVWEDSGDSYYFADGRLLDPSRPYAPVSVQGTTFDALLGAADLLDAESQGSCPIDTGRLRWRAGNLRSRLLTHFWCPADRTFAHALAFEPDGDPQATCVVASSPGHLLANHILDGNEAVPFREQLAERLMEPDLLACAGVRTKSTMAARYRAGSYHNGSSWPWDTGVIADGLRRHGYAAAADDLENRILTACAQIGGFPEFFRGDADRVAINTGTIDEIVDGTPNRLEQPPQARQGWTATRVWRILRARGQI